MQDVWDGMGMAGLGICQSALGCELYVNDCVYRLWGVSPVFEVVGSEDLQGLTLLSGTVEVIACTNYHGTHTICLSWGNRACSSEWKWKVSLYIYDSYTYLLLKVFIGLGYFCL